MPASHPAFARLLPAPDPSPHPPHLGVCPDLLSQGDSRAPPGRAPSSRGLGPCPLSCSLPYPCYAAQGLARRGLDLLG